MALMSINKPAAFAFADQHREEKINGFQEAVFITIGRTSGKDEMGFFLGQIEHGNRETARNAGTGLAYYLAYNRPGQADETIRKLVTLADNRTSAGTSGNAVAALSTIRYFYYSQLYNYNLIFKDKKSRKKFKDKIDNTQRLYDQLETIMAKYES